MFLIGLPIRHAAYPARVRSQLRTLRSQQSTGHFQRLTRSFYKKYMIIYENTV